MINKQQPTNKQQRQILVISIIGILLIIWSTATYFSEHSNIVSIIESGNTTLQETTNEQSNVTINDTEPLISLMQELQINPKNSQLLLKISQYFMQNADWQQAENYALKTIKITQNDINAFYILGISQYNQEKYIEAAQSFQTVLKKENDPAVQYNLGLLYLYYLHDIKKGKKYLNDVLKNPKTTPQLKEAAKKELNTKN